MADHVSSLQHLVSESNPIAEAKNLRLSGWRVGPVAKAERGVFFAGDREGADAYKVLHEGHETQQYEVTLPKALVAMHQKDVTMHLFKKPLWQVHAELGGGVDGGRKMDAKILRAAKRRGYHGIVYLRPMPPAKSEIMVFSPEHVMGTDGSSAMSKTIADKRAMLSKRFLPSVCKSLRPQVVDAAFALMQKNDMVGASRLIASARESSVRYGADRYRVLSRKKSIDNPKHVDAAIKQEYSTPNDEERLAASEGKLVTRLGRIKKALGTHESMFKPHDGGGEAFNFANETQAGVDLSNAIRVSRGKPATDFQIAIVPISHIKTKANAYTPSDETAESINAGLKMIDEGQAFGREHTGNAAPVALDDDGSVLMGHELLHAAKKAGSHHVLVLHPAKSNSMAGTDSDEYRGKRVVNAKEFWESLPSEDSQPRMKSPQFPSLNK